MKKDFFIIKIIDKIIFYYDELKQKQINIYNYDNHKYMKIINFIFNYQVKHYYISNFIMNLYNMNDIFSFLYYLFAVFIL